MKLVIFERRFVLLSLVALTILALSMFEPPRPVIAEKDAVEPRGAAAMARYDRLPYFKRGVTVHQVSTYDRSGGNADGTHFSMYRNPATSGYVVLDENRPGTIYRIWGTGGSIRDGNIRIYFDGEATPRIDVLLADFFSGTHAPFLYPLVGNDVVSSGGFYSYYPLSFAQGVRVEFTQVPQYYHITYHLYNTAEGVTTYTGTEGLNAVYDAWNDPSVDPKDRTGNQVASVPAFDLPAGQTKPLLNLTGAGSIQSFVLNLPQLVATQHAGGLGTITDHGRAHKGSSTFTVTVESNNNGVALIRRLDYGVAGQTADVFVDDQLVGRWSDVGSDQVNHWRDSRFDIAPEFTQGKTRIVIRIQFVSSNDDWTEFYYWVKTIRPSDAEYLTDEVDVGHRDSELAHGYTVTNQTWTGTRTFSYPGGIPTGYDAATFDILSHARIKMYWDGEDTPSVDVPLGYLFGVGSSGEGWVNGLLMGVDPATHTFYNYFPMPYGRSAQVLLVNESARTISGATAEFEYNTTPYEGLGLTAGYFTVVYQQERPTSDGQDYTLVDIPSGKGHIVNTILNIARYNNQAILEGDERIFLDTSEFNPHIHGTGTEDIFNGGWYFNRGIFSLPSHGAPLYHGMNGTGNIVMYRLSVSDVYPFERSLKYNIEHGGGNDLDADYESAIFLYMVESDETLFLTDEFAVGDATSEAVHEYSVTGQTWEGSFSSIYIGRDDGGAYSGMGRAYRGTATFRMQIAPNNSGVRLGRILDVVGGNQKANVFVDDTFAGIWYTGEKNTEHRAYYDFFEISPNLTQNKSSIAVRIEPTDTGPETEWNEFHYYAYSHIFVLPGTPTPTPTVTPTFTPFPDLTMTGKVYDSSAGPDKPVAEASVSAVMCESGRFSTLSQANGEYSLHVPGIYLGACEQITLEVQATGYETLMQIVSVADLQARPRRDLALLPLIPLSTPTATPVPTDVPQFQVYLPLTSR